MATSSSQKSSNTRGQNENLAPTTHAATSRNQKSNNSQGSSSRGKNSLGSSDEYLSILDDHEQDPKNPTLLTDEQDHPGVPGVADPMLSDDSL